MARCSSRFFLCTVELTLHQSVKSVSTKKTQLSQKVVQVLKQQQRNMLHHGLLV